MVTKRKVGVAVSGALAGKIVERLGIDRGTYHLNGCTKTAFRAINNGEDARWPLEWVTGFIATTGSYLAEFATPEALSTFAEEYRGDSRVLTLDFSKSDDTDSILAVPLSLAAGVKQRQRLLQIAPRTDLAPISPGATPLSPPARKVLTGHPKILAPMQIAPRVPNEEIIKNRKSLEHVNDAYRNASEMQFADIADPVVGSMDLIIRNAKRAENLSATYDADEDIGNINLMTAVGRATVDINLLWWGDHDGDDRGPDFKYEFQQVPVYETYIVIAPAGVEAGLITLDKTNRTPLELHVEDHGGDGTWATYGSDYFMLNYALIADELNVGAAMGWRYGFDD